MAHYLADLGPVYPPALMSFGFVFFNLFGLVNRCGNLFTIDILVAKVQSQLNSSFKHFGVKAGEPLLWDL